MLLWVAHLTEGQGVPGVPPCPLSQPGNCRFGIRWVPKGRMLRQSEQRQLSSLRWHTRPALRTWIRGKISCPAPPLFRHTCFLCRQEHQAGRSLHSVPSALLSGSLPPSGFSPDVQYPHNSDPRSIRPAIRSPCPAAATSLASLCAFRSLHTAGRYLRDQKNSVV